MEIGDKIESKERRDKRIFLQARLIDAQTRLINPQRRLINETSTTNKEDQ
jgi:hypothetical protein